MTLKNGTCAACIAALAGKVKEVEAFNGWAWVLDIEGRPALLHWARLLETKEKDIYRAEEYVTACGRLFVNVTAPHGEGIE